jgi:hypothetical protein
MGPAGSWKIPMIELKEIFQQTRLITRGYVLHLCYMVLSRIEMGQPPIHGYFNGDNHDKPSHLNIEHHYCG